MKRTEKPILSLKTIALLHRVATSRMVGDENAQWAIYHLGVAMRECILPNTKEDEMNGYTHRMWVESVNRQIQAAKECFRTAKLEKKFVGRW